MFNVDLVESKAILYLLLNTNSDFYFQKGRISSCHKHGMCMVTYKHSSIKVKEPTANDMSVLGKLLKRKTVVNAKFSPDSGRVIVKRPYVWVPSIPIIQDEKLVLEIRRHLKSLRQLKEANKKWRDRFGVVHKISRFEVDNISFADAIGAIETSENMEIRAGKRLTLRNLKTKEKAVLPIRAPKARLHISKDGQDFLKYALLGETSQVTLANDFLMVVENDVDVLLAGRITD